LIKFHYQKKSILKFFLSSNSFQHWRVQSSEVKQSLYLLKLLFIVLLIYLHFLISQPTTMKQVGKAVDFLVWICS